MATNVMFGSTVRTVKDASGNVTGLSAGSESVQIGTQQIGVLPNRVFAIGDSLTMRQYQSLSGASISVSGTDVTIAQASSYAVPGSYARIINQSNALLNRDVPVIAVTASNFTVRYPFDCTGLFSGTAAFSLYCQLGDTGWLNYAAGLLAAQGKTLNMVRNCGDGGDTVAQVLARISTELAPLVQPGDIIIEMSGINDVLGSATAADIIATKAQIYDALLALGATVHTSTITQAQAAGAFTDGAVALATIKEVNAYIRARCRTESRLHLFDGHTALGGTDYVSSGMETNGVHYLPASAQLIAAAYVTAVGSHYRKADAYRWMSPVDDYADTTSTNLLTNCEFAGATGTTPPTDWTAAGTLTKTYTLAAHADGPLIDLDIAISHSAAAQLTLSQDISARVSGGDRLVFGCEYETVSVDEGEAARMYLEIVADGQTSRHQIGVSGYGYASGGRVPTAGTRYFWEIASDSNSGRNGVLIPVGFTSATIKLFLRIGASGSTEAKFARPYVYKV